MWTYRKSISGISRVNSVKGSGVLLRWMNGNLRLCIVRIVVKRMKLNKDDIIAILLIPAIAVFLIGFYMFIGIFWIGSFIIGGLLFLYEKLRDIDFGFDYDIRSKK